MSTESGSNLLVIDDNLGNRQDLVRYLAAAGYRVRAESAAEIETEQLLSSPPDVVLTTLYSASNKVTSLLEQVKNLKADLPIIVIAQQGVLADSVRALREGAVDYIVAPLENPQQLQLALTKAITGTDEARNRQEHLDLLERSNQELQDYVLLLERDHQAAQKVQERLLPPTPIEFDGIMLRHKIVPSLILSGDFVDYGLLDQRWLCFYLTDVSGHGASSAFVTMWLKQLIRRLFAEKRYLRQGTSQEIDVERFMAAINSELLRSKFGCHLTCFVGIIDLQTRQMRYVMGGHLPLPVLLDGGGARYLQGKGKPLGLFKDVRWQVYETAITEPFSLLVFSDGILEVLPQRDLIEKENALLQIVAEAQGDMPEVMARLGLDSPLQAPDDIAMLVVSSGETS